MELELVNARVAVRAPIGLTPHVDGTDGGLRGSVGGERLARSRRAWFPEAGGFVETPVLTRAELRAGETGSGPIIEEPDSTLVVGACATWTVDSFGNIVVDL